MRKIFGGWYSDDGVTYYRLEDEGKPKKRSNFELLFALLEEGSKRGTNDSWNDK